MLDKSTENPESSKSSTQDGDEIDKVRDLLFGRQHNAVQQDISGLEKSLADLKNLVESNQHAIDDRLDQLDKKIEQYQAQSIKELDGVNTSLINKETAILATLTQEISEQKAGAGDQFVKINEIIASVQSQLDAAKVNRTTLAEKFSDFASQLRAFDSPVSDNRKADQ